MGGNENVGAGCKVPAYSSATPDPLPAVHKAVFSGRAGPGVARANSLGLAAPALAATDRK